MSASDWRTFKVVTKVELLKPSGVSHIWLPAALIRDTPYRRTLSNCFTADGGTVKLTEDKQRALGIVSATYATNKKPMLTLTSRVSLENYTVDLSSRGTMPPVSPAKLEHFLQPTQYVPADGIVKQTALKATAGATTDTKLASASTSNARRGVISFARR